MKKVDEVVKALADEKGLPVKSWRVAGNEIIILYENGMKDHHPYEPMKEPEAKPKQPATEPATRKK